MSESGAAFLSPEHPAYSDMARQIEDELARRIARIDGLAEGSVVAASINPSDLRIVTRENDPEKWEHYYYKGLYLFSLGPLRCRTNESENCLTFTFTREIRSEIGHE